MNVHIVNLPRILDERGNLSFLQNNHEIPFDIKRVYWIYDVPGGEERGGHAFKNQQEVIIALSGSFNVVINEGKKERVFFLNRSHFGLYVPKLIWRSLNNFSTNSLALITSDLPYDADDYIRDYQTFVQLAANASFSI